jgi:hypothetical protein
VQAIVVVAGKYLITGAEDATLRMCSCTNFARQVALPRRLGRLRRLARVNRCGQDRPRGFRAPDRAE